MLSLNIYMSIYVKMNSVDVNSYHPSTDTYLFVKVTENGHEEHVVIDEKPVQLKQDDVGQRRTSTKIKYQYHIVKSYHIAVNFMHLLIKTSNFLTLILTFFKSHFLNI
jgi:hypothetical protein